MGYRPRILFVCTMNQWRSPTAERIWRESPDVEVRSRGLSSKAVRRLNQRDVEWADAIFVMTNEQRDRLLESHGAGVDKSELHVLDIPDDFQLMDPELVDLIRERAGREIERLVAAGDSRDRPT
ncbi:MAG: phosphotyrosine protein phosphatase [Candidatus Eisenbacteria bacterium]